MLILSRKTDEAIVINGNIHVFVKKIEGDNVKIGIQAPDEIKIYRQELFDSIMKSNLSAISPQKNQVLIKGLNLKKRSVSSQ